MRVPGGGRVLSAALVRTMIHPVPLLVGSVNGPENVAPAGRVMTSPPTAAFRAAWRSPPAGTASVRPGGGTDVVPRMTHDRPGGTATATGLRLEPASAH